MINENPVEKSFVSKPDAERIIEGIAGNRPLVLKICRQFLRGKPGAETLAEDVAQETIMKAIKHAGDFRGKEGAELTNWLRRIARNTIFDHFRLQKRRPQADLGTDVENILSGAGREKDLIAALDAEKKILDVEKAVEELKEKNLLAETDQSILSLHYNEGLSTKEIAEKLHMKEGTVKSRLFRVIEKLREALGSRRN